MEVWCIEMTSVRKSITVGNQYHDMAENTKVKLLHQSMTKPLAVMRIQMQRKGKFRYHSFEVNDVAKLIHNDTYNDCMEAKEEVMKQAEKVFQLESNVG